VWVWENKSESERKREPYTLWLKSESQRDVEELRVNIRESVCVIEGEQR